MGAASISVRSAALVSVFGDIDFFCFPEFDFMTAFHAENCWIAARANEIP